MRPVHVGAPRTDADGPRRYLPLQYGFDTRARVLAMDVQDDWDPEIREQWLRNKQSVREHLIHQHGVEDYERKISDFLAMGAAPWSMLDEHNVFLKQVRSAFTQGAYYPALVGACALGERLLNEFVLRLRDDYSSHQSTAKIASRTTISNWVECIEVLVDWGVLTDETAYSFNELRKLRNKSVHFGEHLRGCDARDDALAAVLLVQSCVEDLLCPHGGPPMFIAGTAGQSFIARDAEDTPLVQRFFIPGCVLISPRYDLQPAADGTFAALDDETYQDRFSELTDEEFAQHAAHPG